MFFFFLAGVLGFFVLFWFLALPVYLVFRTDTLGVFVCLGWVLLKQRMKKP